MTTKENISASATGGSWNFNPDTGIITMGESRTREFEMGVNKPVKISWEHWWEKKPISIETDCYGIVEIKPKDIKAKPLSGRECDLIKL
jgi:hypothetical protein